VSGSCLCYLCLSWHEYLHSLRANDSYFYFHKLRSLGLGLILALVFYFEMNFYANDGHLLSSTSKLGQEEHSHRYASYSDLKHLNLSLTKLAFKEAYYEKLEHSFPFVQH